jgi:hypothetical protein
MNLSKVQLYNPPGRAWEGWHDTTFPYNLLMCLLITRPPRVKT